ncbi:MAG: hypothetical protein EXR12_05395 [Rhodospirillaceae bacterium]|nr:hypothetical protein [Rhodospirillaceae bacterium]
MKPKVNVIGDTFVPLTRTLLENPKYRSLGINARRLIDFLGLEYLQHGRATNGYLLAPRRQLESAGIGARHVSLAIEEAEQAGLVVVKRGTGKRPSTYALTWVPMGTPPPATRKRPVGSVATSEGRPLQ